jgi:hypothetical protein
MRRRHEAAREERLRALLREAPVPAAEEAERRGLALVEGAFAQRQRERRSPLPRLALALAAITLLAALLLSPAGAAVRDWVGDVFEAGVPDAERGLSEIPGGGRLLVQSAQGPWVVQPDGSRRLLGDYGEAGWSPRGLFVTTASGRTLSAVEPDGTPHWSLPAPGRVRDPRWSPSRVQIAYRAGRQLRVVAGDGTEDRLLDGAVATLPAAWSPWGAPLLAYVDAGGLVRVVATDAPGLGAVEPLASSPALPGIAAFEWSPAGGALLEASRRALRLRPLALRKTLADVELGQPRALQLPSGAILESAAFSPSGDSVAVLLRRPGGGAREGTGKGDAAGPRSEITLIDLRDFSRRRLFAVTGRLAGLTWSPGGERLLSAWPQADQWLFVPAHLRPGSRPGVGGIRAVADVAAEFAPGAHLSARFPRVEGWCCR